VISVAIMNYDDRNSMVVEFFNSKDIADVEYRKKISENTIPGSVAHRIIFIRLYIHMCRVQYTTIYNKINLRLEKVLLVERTNFIFN